MPIFERDTPELVCVLDRVLPLAHRETHIQSVQKNMLLYTKEGIFPGWPALCRFAKAAKERLLIEKTGLEELESTLIPNLGEYPYNLRSNIADRPCNLSLLLNSRGGGVWWIDLFRAAMEHVLHGKGTGRSFTAIRASSAAGHIGTLAYPEQRFATKESEYFWHTSTRTPHLDKAKTARKRKQWSEDIGGIFADLLRGTQKEYREKIAKVFMEGLAHERHDITISGNRLHRLGLVKHLLRDVPELADAFVEETGITPNYHSPSTDPVARFFYQAYLQELAQRHGYDLKLKRYNTIRTFDIEKDDDSPVKELYEKEDVLRFLRERAAGFAEEMEDV